MANKKNKEKNFFSQQEEKVLDFWQKAKIFVKSVDRETSLGDYVFYDGPPFATGLPHYGHIVASLIKDVVPRYWTMRGYRVERRWGWDCHGLPIENIVEKEMGSQKKKDIEALGVDKFNELCRSKVLSYVKDWQKIITRLGRWADMDNAYKTMDIEFMESVWWVFKELWRRDLIYQDYRSLHICPRCETTLSQSEVTEGYKTIKDLSCVVKFKLSDQPNTYILAWTTTPWTLIGNVALAVNKNINYVLAQIKPTKGKTNKIKSVKKEYFVILAKERVKEILANNNYKIIRTISGQDLVGKEYCPLFNYYKNKNTKNYQNGWKIYQADFVNTDEGTGVVHIAPAFGEDDMNLGKKYNLPFIQHVAMDGSFKPEVKDFVGLNVKPANNHLATDIKIIKHLSQKNLLFSKEKYEHSYPHCWRCDTPLLNYATSSWFVKVEAIKDKMLKLAKNINWFPAHIKQGRFGNWLAGAKDWSISRQRFWASVIPIWVCGSCGHKIVVGSIKELESLSGEKVNDLHKHIVDKITFSCPKCGQTMRRVPDVLDTWFDSGSMPYAQMHYPFANKKKFEQNFPAEFIAEGQDQTRAWFYYLHVISSAIKDSHAFKNVIVNGIVLAADGKKMSKKLNNYPDPALIFDKYGADAMRYYLLASPVMMAENLNFSEKGVQDSLRKVIMILWNVVRFYEIFNKTKAPLSGQQIKPTNLNSDNVLDQWILAQLKELKIKVNDNMESYNLPAAVRPIEGFISDLSTWYLRRSRSRFKDGQKKDKQLAAKTTKYVLIELAKIMAPFTPFMAELVWQKISGFNFKNQNKSVHLEPWPLTKRIKKQEIEIIKTMKRVRKIVELSLAERDQAKIKIRQPLNSLTIKSRDLKLNDDYLALIKDEVNVKKVILIKEVEKEGLIVKLDTIITADLAQEGIWRELVRLINGLRKKANLTIKDKINVYWQSDSELVNKAIKKFSLQLKKDTLAQTIIKQRKELAPAQQKQIKIQAQKVWIGIEKV